jgi:hypothetical protein
MSSGYGIAQRNIGLQRTMCEAIEYFDEVEKLGQDLSLANPLEEIDIGVGIVPKLTFVNKKHVFKAQRFYNKIA